ncbi:MAG: indolepyruvate oxidoreductase subunit beta [Oscillospiraceae bacterium]
MSDVKSCLLVGVGGQGAILISKIMSNGFMKAGYDVKQSEVHGMAQRGGSVSTQVRWGSKVYGPVFGRGEADIMVALEKMEAVRYAEFLKPSGVVVINDYAIKSTTIASGAETYPEGCIEAMARHFKTIAIPASDIALELGNPKCMNVVLFGAMCDSLGCPDIDWEQMRGGDGARQGQGSEPPGVPRRPRSRQQNRRITRIHKSSPDTVSGELFMYLSAYLCSRGLRGL